MSLTSEVTQELPRGNEHEKTFQEYVTQKLLAGAAKKDVLVNKVT